MKVICAVLALTALFCAAAAAETGGDHKDIVTMTIGGGEHQLWLENSATARAFAAVLPLSTKMSELNGNEKYVYLDTALPASPQRVRRVSAGDVMLYGGSCLVVFYKSFDTPFSYTRIGRVADPDALAGLDRAGDVSASFKIAERPKIEMAGRVIEGGTKVNIWFNDVLVPATLNDGATAKALIARLPCTIGTVSRYEFDACGPMSDPLPWNEADARPGWKNGDVNFAVDGNWFTILFGNEENSAGYGRQVNMGRVDCPLSVLRGLKGSYTVRIELAR